MTHDLTMSLLSPMLRDAVTLVEERVATREAVDLAMRLGAGHPQGPLARLGTLDAAAQHLVLGSDPPPWLSSPPNGDGEADGGEPAATSSEAPAERKPVGVVGSGLMASGIAYVAAVAGHDVIVACRAQEAGHGSLARIRGDLDRAVARGRLTDEQRHSALNRTSFETSYASLEEAPLVMEAVTEDLELKRDVFARLEAALPTDTVIATNTSSLRIAEVAARTRHPERVIGLHFFSPVPAMKLVEVIAAKDVAEERLAWAIGWVRGIGKVPVRCVDRNGFIVNRLLIPFLNDAVRAKDEGVASIAEIDEALTKQAGHPLGPFALLDLIGLDVALAAQQSMYAAEGDERLRPAHGLVALVEDGRLGRKTGSGFHDHPVATERA